MIKPYWVGKNATLYHRDCLEVLPELEPNSVDAIITDPPYNISRPNNFSSMKRYNSYEGIDFAEWDHGFDLVAWLVPAVIAMRDPSSIVVWNSWQNLSTIAEYLEELGLSAKRVIVWRKTNPMPTNRDRMFTSSFEFAIWATKGSKWTFNRRTDTYETGYFEYPNNNFPQHPTAKPVGLFKELVEILTNPGDIVLDPFIGSGTTGIACVQTNRAFVGIDIEEEYCKITEQRVQEEMRQNKLV